MFTKWLFEEINHTTMPSCHKGPRKLICFMDFFVLFYKSFLSDVSLQKMLDSCKKSQIHPIYSIIQPHWSNKIEYDFLL